MNQSFKNLILSSTGARSFERLEVIQPLWSGYGEIVRVALHGAPMSTAILKSIRYPSEAAHPRGWNTDCSHRRKIRSYDIEMNWYRQWSEQCGLSCRVPVCYASETQGQQHLMVLEDLDASGFPLRKSVLDWQEIENCLTWLANFHATFMGLEPSGLWTTGTYWHLATRPDEWQAMEELDLKKMAAQIDQRLNNCRYLTLVHGDAKVANFCFGKDSQRVAAVDFQYVGGGCGMKDVAYFIGSCLGEQQCYQSEQRLLGYYFHALKTALLAMKKEIDIAALEAEWREMYPFAWADFHRFLLGWMPTHKKINNYSQLMTARALSQLNR